MADAADTRIVLFGATGYTGRLTAAALVARGERPVLAARDESKLRSLRDELGDDGLECAHADVDDPASVSALVRRGDVLLTTVGPFARFGAAAAQAAADAGAHYLDSTGEASFVRRVFEHFGPLAERSGAGMITSFGADWVPGNLAGAMALADAGTSATRIDIGYFMPGDATMATSGGTRASAAGALLADGFAWRGGRIVTERNGARERTFEVNGKSLRALAVPGSEHFALPRQSAALSDVDVYLGAFGRFTGTARVLGGAVAGLLRVPGVAGALRAGVTRGVRGSTGGPDAQTRAHSTMHTVAIAGDAAGRPLATVRLAGPNAYDFTARILAWGAAQARAGALKGTGALGPVDAFGLAELTAGCAETGLRRL